MQTFGASIHFPPTVTPKEIAKYHKTAIAAENHISTPGNIIINVSVDGSYTLHNNSGSYAVAINRGILGKDKLEPIVWAFPMEAAGGSSQIPEAIAIAEGLIKARIELIRVIRGFISKDPSALKKILKHPVTINIGSDMGGNMEFFRKPLWKSLNPARRNVLEKCFVESHNVNHVPEFPGLKVKTQVCWVPAHRSEYQAPLHNMADRAARRARELGTAFVQVGEGAPRPMRSSQGVYWQLRDSLATPPPLAMPDTTTPPSCKKSKIPPPLAMPDTTTPPSYKKSEYGFVARVAIAAFLLGLQMTPIEMGW